jgi:hypothetical protein
MNTVRKAGLLAAMLMTLTLGVAGCGSNSDATEQPPNTTTGNGGGGNNAGADDREAALVKYSQCMRSNGVPSFPDPVGGRLQLKVQRGGELDPDSPQFQAAQQACKSVEPPGLGTSGQSGKQQEDMLKFVACMRKNGVPNFPDPQPDGRLLINRGAGVDPESAAFKKAEETCRKLLPGGIAPGQ